jgi:hypothetical protein
VANQNDSMAEGLKKIVAQIAQLSLLPDADFQFLTKLQFVIKNQIAKAAAQGPHAGMGGGPMGAGGMGGPGGPPGGPQGGPQGGPSSAMPPASLSLTNSLPPPNPPSPPGAGGGGGGMGGLGVSTDADELRRVLSGAAGPGAG